MYGTSVSIPKDDDAKFDTTPLAVKLDDEGDLVLRQGDDVLVLSEAQARAVAKALNFLVMP